MLRIKVGTHLQPCSSSKKKITEFEKELKKA